jgi:hypothetical protein
VTRMRLCVLNTVISQMQQSNCPFRIRMFSVHLSHTDNLSCPGARSRTFLCSSVLMKEPYIGNNFSSELDDRAV